MSETSTLKVVELTNPFAFGCPIESSTWPTAWGAQDVPPGTVTLTQAELDAGTPVRLYAEILSDRPSLSTPKRLWHIYGDRLPDDETPGWLSVSDPYFEGTSIPEGAFWGYTLNLLQDLNDLPLNSDDLLRQDPEIWVNGAPISPTWYQLTPDGLWWLRDGWENAPFKDALFGVERTIELRYKVFRDTDDATDASYVGVCGSDINPCGGDIDSSTPEEGVTGTSTLPIAPGAQDEPTGDGIRTLHLVATQHTKLQLTLADALMEVPETGVTVAFNTFAENLQDSISYVVDVEGTTGTVTDYFIEKPGLYQAHASIFDTLTNNLLYTAEYLVLVDPFVPTNAIASIRDIRASLFDLIATDNELIGTLEFRDSEIIEAMSRTVDRLNTTGLVSSFTFSTIPRELRWGFLRGVSAELLLAAGIRYQRNHLPYQAGGVSIDDKNKAAAYLQMAQLLQADFNDAVLSYKARVNIQNGFVNYV